MGFSVHDDVWFVAGLLDDSSDIDFMQLQINYLDWDSDVIQSHRCYEEAVSGGGGVPVVTMEPVKRAALMNLPEKARRILERVDLEASLASWALRFTVGPDGVETVLSGDGLGAA